MVLCGKKCRALEVVGIGASQFTNWEEQIDIVWTNVKMTIIQWM